MLGQKIKKFLQVSLLKTIRFNFHYFGLKGLLRCRVIVARNVKLKKLKGSIELKNVNSRIDIGFFNEYPQPSKRNHSFYWNQGGKITFENSGYFRFARGTCVFVGEKAHLSIQRNFHLGPDGVLSCEKEISIGEDVSVSWGTMIWDCDGHCIYDKNTGKRVNENEEIKIGNHVWIGCNVFVSKGSSIKDGTVIAAWSKVSHALDEGDAIYAGNKLIKSNIEFSWIER